MQEYIWLNTVMTNRVGILKVTSSNEAEVFQKAYELAVKNNMHKYIAKLISSYKIQDKSKAIIIC